ncbi:MAG TPA: ribosome recycling factor [bacterium]|nr:ribosome recycling factor [bacterium]
MPQNIFGEVEQKMKKTIEHVQNELAMIHTGKASSALVENIRVDYYGTPTRLKELAGISTPEARMIVVQPWDQTALAEIDKAIKKANLGYNPVIDGKLLRIRIPELSEERRREMDKVVKKIAEDGRVAIRSERRDANEKIKHLQKDHKITEDEMFKWEKIVQDKTDEFIKEIDKILTVKEKEILQV